MSDKLSHISDGNARMVDVSEKSITLREAVARGEVHFPADVWKHLQEENFHTPKGAIVETARIAGIMAAKQTGQLIPLCHPLPITFCDVTFETADQKMVITATARIQAGTGVEMEALTAVSVAALTVYDMTKALSHDIAIEHVRLIRKTGGKKDVHNG
jgi:cyclic pyranopterin phosphate synthase